LLQRNYLFEARRPSEGYPHVTRRALREAARDGVVVSQAMPVAMIGERMQLSPFGALIVGW
jgi:hypothetical protein